MKTLHELFRHEHTIHIEKTYLTLLDGQWQFGDKSINIGISKVKRSGEHMMQADASGDYAVSHFTPLEIFENCSLMQVMIETGRTHQIRVHASYAGHPVIGDSKYGNKASNRHFRELGLKRLFLHAWRLYLPLADPITVTAPLSDDLEDVLQKLRQPGTWTRQE
jgi:23S rRNA pseudouridine955/2504/2580 synthase